MNENMNQNLNQNMNTNMNDILNQNMNTNMNENVNQNLNTGKPKKGKTIALIVLIILVLGLAGYITYDKINDANVTKQEQKETDKLKTQVKTLTAEKKKIAQEAKVQEEALQQALQQAQSQESKNDTPTNFINAIYKGQNSAGGTEFLTLFNDGKFIGFVINGGGSHGTYKINGTKILFHSSDTEGPSIGSWECEISQDRTQIKSNNSTLNKMD